MLSPDRVGDPRLAAALDPLIGAIPVAAMRQANYRVDRDVGKQSPDAAARWLEATLGL
jgi:osmoprotectant transport system permease protein